MPSSTLLSRPALDGRSEPRLAVGYLWPTDGGAAAADEALLWEAGCDAVRAESAADGPVLTRLVAFLAPGDLLVLPRVGGLPGAYGGLERLLRELDTRGAAAVFVDEALRTDGEEGRLLRRAVAAVAELRPRPKPRPTAAVRAKALAMQAAGARPGEIARSLRISRMTLWRWLKGP